MKELISPWQLILGSFHNKTDLLTFYTNHAKSWHLENPQKVLELRIERVNKRVRLFIEAMTAEASAAAYKRKSNQTLDALKDVCVLKEYLPMIELVHKNNGIIQGTDFERKKGIVVPDERRKLFDRTLPKGNTLDMIIIGSRNRKLITYRSDQRYDVMQGDVETGETYMTGKNEYQLNAKL